MRALRSVRRVFRNSDAIVQGLDNQSRMLSERSEAVVQGLDNQSKLLNARFNELVQGLDNQSGLLDSKLDTLAENLHAQLITQQAMIARQDALIELQKAEIAAIRGLLKSRDAAPAQAAPAVAAFVPADKAITTALARLPLMIDSKTYNTSHPDYNSTLVRNFPGKILNADKRSDNIIYAELKRLAEGDEVPNDAWDPILKSALEEVKTVPHAEQMFERRAFIENYMKEISEKYGALYNAGWVNLDDALFLYWLVRTLKPRTIVQTGVCNGLSSAFMVLALAKNGADGKLRAVDRPPIFNPRDPTWTIKGKVYGIVIPEGKTSGWMVPDAYQDRFEVRKGGARTLLSRLVDDVDSIDLFYHDSNHTYNHMMFEFKEAKRKLKPGGLVVADDVSWNASVWDFADEHAVPSYNFKGTVGVAFL